MHGGGAGHQPSSQPFTGAMRDAFEQLVAGDLDRSVSRSREVMQANSSWIVTSGEEGLVVIDQQAAHERVLYERFLAMDRSMTTGQALMFPVMATVPRDHISLIAEYEQELQSMGFSVKAQADGVVHISAVPPDVHTGSEEATLLQIVRALADLGPTPTERRHSALAAIMASRQSVRRGDRLGVDEQARLVVDLFECAVPHVTPGGRPTYIIVSYDELVRRFQ